MLTINDITNKKQLNAVINHKLDISVFSTKEELSKYLLDKCKRKYYENNKDRFKEYYKQNSERIRQCQKDKRNREKASISEQPEMI